MAKTARRPLNGQKNRGNRYQSTAYVEGNAVRKIQAVPQIDRKMPRPSTSRETRKNREKALQMNIPYVIFITLAAVATLFLCVHYLQLQAENTTYRKSIISLESQLSSIKLANDTKYEETASSIDMTEIKEKALKEYGMVYAGEGQIITYSSQDTNYLKQYGDVPTNK